MRWPSCLLSVVIVPLVLADAAHAQEKAHDYDPLGRVIVSEVDGGTNDGKVRSTCFDTAGNRVDFESSTTGNTVTCAAPSTAPAPPGAPEVPDPPPTPPSNSPPVTVDDVDLMSCDSTMSFDVAANDYDHDDQAVPTLTIVSGGGGIATANVVSGMAEVAAGLANGTAVFIYTVKDTQGLTATGTLTVHVVGNCEI